MKLHTSLDHLGSVIVGHRIGGQTVPGEERLELADPARVARLTGSPDGGQDWIDEAVAVARAALNGQWRATKPVERGRLLTAISRAIAANEDRIAAIETLCMGKPLKQARGDVRTAARFFEYYAGVADKIEGETIPLGQGMLAWTELEPVGVNAQIVPWNAPLAMLARGLAPALAAGCTVVAKPAETTPLSALILSDICTAAGLPDGVLNIVLGGRDTGAALSGNADVDHVTFTGSVAAGKKVMASASQHLASVTLELGGKSPLVVLRDADLDRAADGVVRGIFWNAGQICAASARLIVEAPVAEPLLDKVVERAKRLTLGHGLDDPDLGPLASKAQFHRVGDALVQAERDGDTVLLGGKPAEVTDLPGYFYPPTILRTRPDSQASRREIFGPVLAVSEVPDAAAATELANDCDYGLVGGIYTRDMDRALAFARALNVSQVFVNGYLAGGVETPVGGRKDSGFGREKGLRGLQAYLSTKCTTVTFSE
ncbi:aldehyde dehydrogenase family protein [Silicimonas algicola]|uniref:Aldehyde dehydrogenase (Acceptor) n=1 Tax=Silicimonas algicola TaxID=1826607 RepID=A0A316G9E6_9RHOB|nr:aldehyde dehydrogenase family protein [Silicimonas algicola]AZQ67970.1 aldehyde dehydrogenase family protein [Silicimonas algicola]PWK57589.1 aldehyde dehydrogenase (acceptor) [Silicimonas algicola]